MRAAVATLTVALISVLGFSVPAHASEASAEDYIVRATNAYRTSHGESALASYSAMDWVPGKWSDSMASTGSLQHNPSFGSQIPQAGLQAWGENVAYACGRGSDQANAEAVMQAWKKSSGHRANMLSSRYTHLAVGVTYDAKRDCLWATQNFGKYAAGTAPSLNTGTPFSDVMSSDQFADEIVWLSRTGITTGYADGTFRPKDAVSREAFAAFLFRLEGSPRVSLPSRSPFKDVATDDQFYREIVWLADSGITTGWADGTFRPKEEISREAMAAFLYRFEGRPSYSAPKSSPFDDMSPRSKFYREVTWLRSTGITTGYSDGTFRPLDEVTREATAAFFQRM